MILIRSLVFTAIFYVWSVIYAIAMVPLLVAPRGWLLAALRFWSLSVIVLLRVICGIRVEIRGREYAPAGDALIANIVRTSNGRLTAAEALGHREFSMTKLYRSA